MTGLNKWWKSRNPRERKIISVALILAVVYAFSTYVFDPVYSKYNANKNELTSRSALLKRYQHLIQASKKHKERGRKCKALERGVESVLLTGATADLANAELQGLVKNLAQKTDISFTQISSRKTVEVKGFTAISLNIPFRCTIQQLQKFLFALDNSPQLIRITKLKINKLRRKKGLLKVEMDVEGYIRTPEKEEDSSAKNGSDHV